MRKRTRKLLSIVLASAMVLSMHSMAFAEEAEKNEVTYADGAAVIKNATDPVSWNGWKDNEDDAFAALLGHVEDDHLANGKKVTVSNDSGSKWSTSYNVIPLEGVEGSYLLFGYGSYYSELDFVEGEGLVPITEYDGRKKVAKGSDSATKDVALYGDLALVKYDSAAKTVTKVDGVELTDLKPDKNNLNASISANKTEPIKGGRFDGYLAHKNLEGKTTPTVSIKAKVSGKNIDKATKKAITTALKKASYPYEILPKVVQIYGSAPLGGGKKVSENLVEYSDKIHSNIDASKLNTKSAKATLTYDVTYYTKKDEPKVVAKKLNPKDYTLESATVGDESIIILKEFKSTNYEYANYYYDNDKYASQGYLLCFREHGEKKNKTVRKGIYKSADDVFVTSVE